MRSRSTLAHRAAAAVLALAACAPSLRELDADNQHALSRAESTAAAAGTPFTPATIGVADPHPPPDDPYRDRGLERAGAAATLAADAGWHGLLDGEHVVALRGTGELVLLGGVCVRRSECGECATYADYRYVHARDGHVVIIRLHPHDEVVARHDDPSCPAGCAGGTPRLPPAAQGDGKAPPTIGERLGITSLDQLEIRDDAYTVKLVDDVCTNTTPVP